MAETQILYLKRLEDYKKEKPFEVLFSLKGFADEAKQTNCVLEPTPVLMLNARQASEPPSLRKNGFQLIHSPCPLSSDDFDDKHAISEIYLPLVKRCVLEVLEEPAEMHILNHKVFISILLLAILM